MIDKNEIITIAIDGPSGAGKSTVAKMLARELNYLYLDTGAMYRAVGLKVFRVGIGCEDLGKVEELLKNTEIDIKYVDGVQRVFLDGEDVSEAIREHHISKVASDVSALPPVRLKMVDLQRKIALSKSSILDGRDIGTYVLPNADYKFYLTADLDVRAYRRYNELTAKGMSVDLANVKKDIASRDYNDMNRDFAPLKKADDAIEVDSSKYNIDETLKVLVSYLRKD